MGREKSSIYDLSVALKSTVSFEMCTVLGPGEEVLIDSVEEQNVYGHDSCLMKTFSVYSTNSQSYAFV